jgi:hypothetical protein
MIDVTRTRARRAIPVAETPDTATAPRRDLELDGDLAGALAALPPKQKQAVAYHYLAGRGGTGRSPSRRIPKIAMLAAGGGGRRARALPGGSSLADGPLHLQLDQPVQLERVFHRQFPRDRLDEAAHDGGRGLVLGIVATAGRRLAPGGAVVARGRRGHRGYPKVLAAVTASEASRRAPTAVATCGAAPTPAKAKASGAMRASAASSAVSGSSVPGWVAARTTRSGAGSSCPGQFLDRRVHAEVVDPPPVAGQGDTEDH